MDSSQFDKPSFINQLLPEVLECVFSFLSTRELLTNCRFVSRSFNRSVIVVISHHRYVAFNKEKVKELLLSNHADEFNGIPPEFLFSINFDIVINESDNQISSHIATKYGILMKSLQASLSNYDHVLFLLKMMPNLKRLSIHCYPLNCSGANTNDVPEKSEIKLYNLKYFEIRTYWSDDCHVVPFLKFVLEEIGCHLTTLTFENLGFSESDFEQWVDLIVKTDIKILKVTLSYHCPGAGWNVLAKRQNACVQELNIYCESRGQNGAVDVTVINEFLRNCTALKTLELGECHHLTPPTEFKRLDLQTMTSLTTLSLSGKFSIFVPFTSSQFPCLETVKLSNLNYDVVELFGGTGVHHKKFDSVITLELKQYWNGGHYVALVFPNISRLEVTVDEPFQMETIFINLHNLEDVKIISERGDLRAYLPEVILFLQEKKKLKKFYYELWSDEDFDLDSIDLFNRLPPLQLTIFTPSLCKIELTSYFEQLKRHHHQVQYCFDTASRDTPSK